MSAFHEVRFPTAIARASEGGPERRTEIVTLGSGHEERNARWADSRRTYNAGYGIRSLDDLHDVVAFFEERRGRLTGFRWRDHSDWKSCSLLQQPSPTDQLIGVGDGLTATFQLCKLYGRDYAPYRRQITKPVAGTVVVAVDGMTKAHGLDFNVDITSGVVSFVAPFVPAPASQITAGFEFDVPVRFDTDRLEVSIKGLSHGAIPNIPIVEIRL